ncbi:hypothetical protein [Kribbella kalugense]|uniref:Uncharacterized protein n=1 Tax=Kribbella kalugense TaxID=2512221 RepID=A0A4R7ZL23_9ACTN|nr:hypothetical protein [Kribbella kalugense]TDW17251.1 hypothetical protein EV650_3816 [Kribbella kalugense]
MFNTPLSQDFIKAESAYRLERTKRDFRSATRRQRAERASQPEPRHARRTLRPTTAA